MSSEQQWMREAIQLARQNVRDGLGGPFAALIVKEGRVIARGTNQVTSSNDPTAHAEVVAIRNACKELGSFQLDGCEIYASCEPCPMCLGAIYWARPDRVFFAGRAQDAADAGFDDSFIYDQIARHWSDRAIPMMELLRDEALEAFQEWIEKPDKVAY